MGLLNLILLIVGIALVIYGAVTLTKHAWVLGAIEVVVGLIVLGAGGFVHL